jgi:trimeric autotransporter adhesin
MQKRFLVPRQQLLTLFSVMICGLASGQTPEALTQASVAAGVPRLVKFSGVLKNASGSLLAKTVGLTFAIYSEQTGGVPLWQETQNVQFAQGRYTVFLGQSTSAGIPAELFASGQPRWLGVKALLPGEEEQPRVLLASVPYALKAVDADTLGGLPASAFIQASGSNSSVVVAPGSAPDASIHGSLPSASKVTTSGGTAGTIAEFDSATDIKNSPIVVNSAPTDLTDVVGMANLQVRNFGNVLNADQFLGTGNHDIGDKINQAYAACPSNGCKIKVAAGIYPYTTPIVFAGRSKPVVLEGDAGETGTYTGYPTSNGTTELYYTPASGAAITMATGGGTGSGVQGITLFGPGFSNGANTATGLSLTSDIRQSYKDLFISGFNIGLQIGSNVYLDYFYNLQMLDNVKDIYSPPGITGTGENIAFIGGVLTNKSKQLPGGGGSSVPFYTNCVDFEGGQGIVISFYNISFDHCGVTLNIPGGQQFYFSGSHWENAGGPTALDFLTIGANCVSCNVVMSGSDILEDPPSAGRTELISIAGGSRLTIVGGIYLAVGSIPQAIKSTHPANAITVLGADKLNSIAQWVTGQFSSTVTMNPREYQPLTVAGGPIILGSNPTAHGNITSTGLSGLRTWAFPDASGTVVVSTTGGNVTVPGNLAVAGSATVTGSLNVTGSKHFKIDDPLDPANKYLYHTSVESPDMMNIYNGTVILDAKGEAEIQLPDWFEALNRNFRYQLTCIGGFAPVYVSREIENNTFRVAGGTSGLKLSWQVTGVRHDAYAEAHRSPVEVEKPADERGHYLHPELFGASQDKVIGAH